MQPCQNVRYPGMRRRRDDHGASAVLVVGAREAATYGADLGLRRCPDHAEMTQP